MEFDLLFKDDLTLRNDRLKEWKEKKGKSKDTGKKKLALIAENFINR